MAWDIDRYCDRLSPRQRGQNEGQEAQQASRFPPLSSGRPPGAHTRPAIFTDRHLNILVWYLPDILLYARRVSGHPNHPCKASEVDN